MSGDGPEVYIDRLLDACQVLQGAQQKQAMLKAVTDPEHPIGFERLLSDLCARLVNAPAEQVASEIGQGMEQIIEFFGLDRGILGCWTAEGPPMVSTQSWVAPGVMPVPVFDWNVDIPWVYRHVLHGEAVTFSRVEDMPGEAAKDRAFFKGMGTRSHISLPLKVGGEVLGVLVFGSLRTERTWPDDLVQRLQLVADIIAGAVERRQKNLRVQERMRFEALLADLSNHFINLPPEQIDGAIEDAQRRIVKTLGLDRSTLWQISETDKDLVLTHQWARAGCLLIPKQFVKENYPWMLQKVLKGEVVLFSRANELPPEAARDIENIRKFGPKSNVTVPLYAGRRLVGGLAFGSLHEERRWSDELVGWLKLIAQVFASVLGRKQAEEEARKGSEEWQTTFDSIQDSTMILDREFKILRVNAATISFFKLPPEKMLESQCHALMHGTTEPVEICPLTRMMKTKRHEETELYDEKRGAWFQVSVDPILADGGEITRVVHTVKDITVRKQAELRLEKAFEEISQLKEQLEAENVYLREDLQLTSNFGEIIGRSDGIKYVFSRVEQVAPTDSAVLILGETGTGKGLIARAVHNLSARRSCPLVNVDCAALPPNLIESELFGRERGAFTGAASRQIGHFELAHTGTIILDEIGELSLGLQAKLLRAIQEGEFERLGSPRTIKVDVRIIASTSRDLIEEVRNGRFREDLFYRLHVFPITIPPLRKRQEDILLLVNYFVNKFAAKMRKDIKAVPSRTLTGLQKYAWPGNVRELEHVIERAVIITRGSRLELAERLEPHDFVEPNKQPKEKPIDSLIEVERIHIQKILEKSNWKIEGEKGAASLLSLKPSTLGGRMRKLGIDRIRNYPPK